MIPLRCLVVLPVILAGFLLPAQAQKLLTPEENAWARTWIPTRCCVTGNCCFRVKATDVTPLPEDNWKINVTGQVIKRTDYSQDGAYWRCACTMEQSGWVVKPTSQTFCFFPPMQSAEAR